MLSLTTCPKRAFQAALPAMIDVLQHALQTGDEQSARHLFDVFETLLILVGIVLAFAQFLANISLHVL
jgi:hypothetical protein